MKVSKLLCAVVLGTSGTSAMALVRCEASCTASYRSVLDKRDRSVAYEDFDANCQWLGGRTQSTCYPGSGPIDSTHWYCEKLENPTSTGYGYGDDVIEAREEARKSCKSGLPDLATWDCTTVFTVLHRYQETSMECE